MIKINNLTKIYKSKKKNNCKALDNLTLTLPNNGLVFVLGKSGSGKSTLLNLIGGLDSITSGKIIVDGNKISSFKEKEFCDYRNNHIGFIFQDYHLIDELTVYENIVLSLNLRRIEDKEDVKNALKKVDLEGYENRFPTELSGGERQRVAIARAIVKNPRIILADEPTGNLDTNTAITIISILKELSKECLILIVSHNVVDANKYADRIIELSNGKIVNDVTKNTEFNEKIEIKDNKIIYPVNSTLSEEDISVLNENKGLEFKLNKDKFIKTSTQIHDESKSNIDKTKLSFKKVFKLSLKFLKSKILSISISSFMISAIMVILALAQTIVTFDAGQVIADEMDKMNRSAIFMNKIASDEVQKELNRTVYDEVLESDILKFKESGYKGEIYEILNICLPINGAHNAAGWVQENLSNSLYITETIGTAIVDEKFLAKKFDGCEYICKLDEFHPAGQVITDYVADSILFYNSKLNAKSYKDLLGDFVYKNSSINLSRGYINGIIKTDYKEKYKGLFDLVLNNPQLNFSNLINDEVFISFTDDVFSRLGISFTTNKDFKNAFILNDVYKTIWAHGLKFDNNVYYSFKTPAVWNGNVVGRPLKDNEIMIHYHQYNEIYGTEYTSSNLDTFVPHSAKIEGYRYADIKQEHKKFSIDVNIVGLVNSGQFMFASDNVYQTFKENYLFTRGLYFEGNQNIDKIIDLADDLNFETKTIIVEGIYTMTKAVDVFVPVFELVAIVLCVGIVLILISFSSRMIKNKMHEIGILKALGTQNVSITSVFGLQVVLIAILTIVMSTIGYFVFIGLANTVLIESLKQLAPTATIFNLNFLTFRYEVALINLALTLVLSIISLIVPMLKIKNIKPVKVIKAKD